jgi:glycosyltransferase involved in cell wall biosynthesis
VSSLTAESHTPVKVVQTVHGKFHHFDLARQLHRQGMLEAIFTGYPRWKLRNEMLPAEKIKTFPRLRTFLMAKWHFGFENPWLDRELNWWAALSLDGYVASRLPNCDVFVGLSGSGLKTGGLIKRRGGSYICDRGSTHIRFAERIMAEEFRRWGHDFPGIDHRAVAREEQEYSLADLITVPSWFCVRSFVEMGVHLNKLRKIPYGVDVGRFRKVADSPRDCFEVLFVGQVSFRKGVPYLLEAFKALKHPKKRLRIVGAMQQEMRRFLRDRKFDGVDFLGPVPQRNLVSIMSSSHVMVLPSIEDGSGLVLGQAMACGCPIICSTNTGGEELLPEHRKDFIVPIRDSVAIANRLDRLCQDAAERDRMSEEAVRIVKDLGGWDDYGRQFGQVCHDLMRQKSSAPPGCACVA